MDFKNSVYWNIFADVWQCFKAAYPPVDDEKYWDKMCTQVGEVFRKYESGEASELAKSLSLAILDFLEKKYKEGRKDETS